jgi:hypothetical protein
VCTSEPELRVLDKSQLTRQAGDDTHLRQNPIQSGQDSSVCVHVLESGVIVFRLPEMCERHLSEGAESKQHPKKKKYQPNQDERTQMMTESVGLLVQLLCSEFLELTFT